MHTKEKLERKRSSYISVYGWDISLEELIKSWWIAEQSLLQLSLELGISQLQVSCTISSGNLSIHTSVISQVVQFNAASCEEAKIRRK